jgi:hypothetical protein
MRGTLHGVAERPWETREIGCSVRGMEPQNRPTRLPLRGLIAPGFLALGIAGSTINLRLDSHDLGWGCMIFMALALAFAKDTRQLFTRTTRILAREDDDARRLVTLRSPRPPV